MLGSMMSSVMSDSGCCTASSQRRLGGGGVQHREALGLELHADQLRGLDVVFHDQRGARAGRRRDAGTAGVASRRDAPPSSGARSGSQTVKHEPSPTALSTATVPPCSSARSLTIARPEAGALELARQAAVDLAERLEQLLQALRRRCRCRCR